MAAASRSYTSLSTHMASTSTRCETHAPRATNASAAATCFASSRVTRRTSTFVSAARMAPLDVPPHTLFHLGDRPGPGRPRKQRLMNLGRGERARATDNDLLAILVPLQDRARPDTELLPDLGRHGD